jgi:hypothetical protein
MRSRTISILPFFVIALTGFASSLGTAVRSVIPADVQQVINLDCRRMKNSDTAMALKAKFLPPNMKQFEDALQSIGIKPDRDWDQITLASFRTKDHGLDIMGIVGGQFPRKKINARLVKQENTGKKLNGISVYPMAGGMSMAFLDDFTMLFGDEKAVQAALDVRDNSAESLNANSQVTDMIPSVDAGTVWSVLDASGAQDLMESALGSTSNLAEYDTVKRKLLGARYTMDFDHGVDFNLNVITADAVTAATLSTLLKAGMLFKKMTASPAEKLAIDAITVDSDSGRLIVHYKADDESFQSLLESPWFVSVFRQLPTTLRPHGR